MEWSGEVEERTGGEEKRHGVERGIVEEWSGRVEWRNKVKEWRRGRVEKWSGGEE